MAKRSERSYPVAPELAFDALSRAVPAAGFVVQGADASRRTVYFNSGRKGMSGSVQAVPDGSAIVSLFGAPDDLHDRIASELQRLQDESQALFEQHQPPSASADLATDLERLGGLRERGLLTEQEYAAAKARAFAQPTPPTSPSSPTVPPMLSHPTAERGAVSTSARSSSTPKPPTAGERSAGMSNTLKVVLGVVGAVVILGSWGALSQDSSEPTEFTPTPVEAVEDIFSNESSGQSNARRQAENYLDSQAFSRKGLIDQLEYEGYSTVDATYAVDNVSVDWNEQAALKAAQYLDSQSFSRQGLLDQLLYEGFTRSQASYGVSVAY